MLNGTFKEWIAMHKAMELWFHQAHHNVRGTSFASDHVELYGNIYDEVLGTAFDTVVERGIGLTEDQSLANAVDYAIGAANILKAWRTPSTLSAEQLAAEAKHLLKEYLEYLRHLKEMLDLHGELTPGLDDFIAAHCSDLETQVYLVGQRASF
jgi:DNA-binding ferritin-like protein